MRRSSVLFGKIIVLLKKIVKVLILTAYKRLVVATKVYLIRVAADDGVPSVLIKSIIGGLVHEADSVIKISIESRSDVTADKLDHRYVSVKNIGCFISKVIVIVLTEYLARMLGLVLNKRRSLHELLGVTRDSAYLAYDVDLSIIIILGIISVKRNRKNAEAAVIILHHLIITIFKACKLNNAAKEKFITYKAIANSQISRCFAKLARHSQVYRENALASKEIIDRVRKIVELRVLSGIVVLVVLSTLLPFLIYDRNG